MFQVQDVIRAANTNEMGLERNDIEVALRIMSDDSDQIVRRIGDSAGGLYVVGNISMHLLYTKAK